MDRIVECVPNFSTSEPQIIDQITASIKGVSDVKLLDVDPDTDYNRVVVTFVGTPGQIGKAAFAAISKATELIDMTNHTGEHPRLGATDVCPFIPVKNASFEECIEIANEVGKSIGEELEIPVYLYGKAATSEKREKLSNIRKGEYEGLEQKIQEEDWKPDFGPTEFVPKSGAVVVGVRDFLIAYNVNLDTDDVSIANEIAGIVRESGRWEEKDGERVRVPGKYKGIQAMGVTLERPNRKLTQVSMNVVNFKKKTGLHEIYEGIKEVAKGYDVTVTGSELVGLIPLEAVIMAGQHYAPAIEDRDQVISKVINQLGLDDLAAFDPSKRIIEIILENESLVDMTVEQFIAKLASDSPAPGGGSVSALGGSLAAALITMVGRVSKGEKYQEVRDEINKILDKSIPLTNKLESLIDEDTSAFNKLMSAYRMSKEQPEKRSNAIQKATIQATEVPLKVAELSMELFDLLEEIVQIGNKNAITDAAVGALFAASSVQGALYNVQINLLGIKDNDIKQDFQKKVTTLLNEVETNRDNVLKYVKDEISLP